MWGAFGSGAALAATAALFGLARGRLTPRLGALTLALVVGPDLWLTARSFWRYSKLYEADPLVTRVAATPPPFRVLDLGAYPGSVLAAFDVPQVLGYHGNELRYYDELLGGKNEWRNRSEEHTSELQSRLHLVCRLLLEKKKDKARDQTGHEHT